MPATSHPNFQEAADADATLWRYMDFESYVWMLENQALFFTRADQFEDPYEGSTTEANMQAQVRALAGPGNIIEGPIPDVQEIKRSLRQFFYINCWHKNQGESAAMWKLYGRSNQAIAIRSTARRLREALADEAVVSEVRYINYATTPIPTDSPLWPYLHKRLSFEYEHEVRAVIEDGVSAGTVGPDESPGLTVRVDLGALIEKVFVAPESPLWLRELVDQVTRRYGLPFAIDASSMDQRPVY